MEDVLEEDRRSQVRPIARARCYSEGTDISTLKDHLVSPTPFKEKQVEYPISTESSGDCLCLCCLIPWGCI